MPEFTTTLRGPGLLFAGDVRDRGRICRCGCGQPCGSGPANKVYATPAHEQAHRLMRRKAREKRMAELLAEARQRRPQA
jgi:hypothetical protein